MVMAESSPISTLSLEKLAKVFLSLALEKDRNNKILPSSYCVKQNIANDYVLMTT